MKKNSYSYEDLILCGKGELFGPGNAQLPQPPMLMFDRITSISESGGDYGKGGMTAELDINKDLWFFDCHFNEDPVMPGCLGVDAMWQLPHGVDTETPRHYWILIKMAIKKPQIFVDIKLSSHTSFAIVATTFTNACYTVKHEHRGLRKLSVTWTKQFAFSTKD